MVKKLYIFLIVLFIYSCTVPLETEDEVTSKSLFNNIDEDKNLICFGDSITSGYGIGKENSYPTHLQKDISLKIINAGVSGDSTFDALDRLSKDVINNNPGVVLIQFGANDFSYYVKPDLFKDNLDKIVKTISATTSEIYLISFCSKSMIDNLIIGDKLFFSQYNISIDINQELINLLNEYSQIYKEVSTSNGIYLIDDIWDGIWGIDELLYDGLHPNIEGSKLMAENILESIIRYIEGFE